MTKPRVLLIAEAANPEWASVPLVGWSHARALADVAETHLVTHVRNREAILRAGLVEGRDFTAVDSEAIAGPMYRLGELLRGGAGRGWTTLSALTTVSYYYFEHLVWRRFGARLRAREFDLVHRLTPLSPVTPSLLASSCRRIGIPFLLGPLNGGVPWPRGFDAARRREREWLSYVRNAYRLLPGYRSTLSCSAALMIASRDTWAQVPAVSRKRCVYIPE
ncbi:MAG: glycosyltransferase family 1 protein, partial [Planctomycetota bacterium]